MPHSKISYPELYFSSQISSLLEETPSLPKEPSLPQKPIMPNNPGEYDSGGGCSLISLSVISVIGSIIACIALITADDVDFSLLLYSILYFLFSLFIFIIAMSDKELHEKKKNEYTQAIKQYPFLLERYEKELAAYKEKKQTYLSQKEFLLSKNNIEKYRAKKIAEYLTNLYETPIFKKCQDTDVVKKGASEDYFVKKLRKLTNWDVYTEQKVPVGTKFFYPDIIIGINEIYINVEIDEPYAGNDGTPIHYVEDNFLRTSIDKDRNDYMTRNGWIVIRFAEEQIFLHTDECIEYIAKVIDSILKGKGEITVSEQFIKDKWNKEQSYKMSYKRFRRTYVPQKYQSNIDKEDYRSYSDIREDIFIPL